MVEILPHFGGEFYLLRLLKFDDNGAAKALQADGCNVLGRGRARDPVIGHLELDFGGCGRFEVMGFVEPNGDGLVEFGDLIDPIGGD